MTGPSKQEALVQSHRKRLGIGIWWEHTFPFLHDVDEKQIPSIVPKENIQCAVKIFFFTVGLGMLMWTNILVFKPPKIILSCNLLNKCNSRQAQTRCYHVYNDQYCYYSLSIWQSSIWRSFTVSRHLNTHKDDTLLKKYLQTNHCGIFVQLRFTLCLNIKTWMWVGCTMNSCLVQPHCVAAVKSVFCCRQISHCFVK